MYFIQQSPGASSWLNISSASSLTSSISINTGSVSRDRPVNQSENRIYVDLPML